MIKFDMVFTKIWWWTHRMLNWMFIQFAEVIHVYDRQNCSLIFKSFLEKES